MKKKSILSFLFYPVKSTGKQMPQVVRKHLLRRYSRILAQSLHFLPDPISTYRLSAACCKNGA